MSIEIGDVISVGKAKKQGEVIAISPDKTRIGVRMIGGSTRDIPNPEQEPSPAPPASTTPAPSGPTPSPAPPTPPASESSSS